MSFVSLGGDGSARPTFFEMVAADRLMGSLKAATMYSLSVMTPPPRFRAGPLQRDV
jgi:peroxin-12